MRVRLKKRIVCYMLDLFIISILGFLVSIFIPRSIQYVTIQNQISILNENFLNSEINFSNYFFEFSRLSNELDRCNILYTSINFCIVIFYFIIFPLILKGKTVGMKICKLSLRKKRDKQGLFMIVFIRSVIAYGLLYYLVQLAIMYLIPSNIYFIMLTILAIIQILVVICSAFMIKYRDDKRSLADILSCSNILIES